jgi:hypothetical protein
MPPESGDGKKSKGPPEPWASFLRALDEALDVDVQLHCLGGFVVTLQFGLSRGTSDIDAIAAVPNHKLAELLALAGEGSGVHRRYGVYLQAVTVAQYPENYESRLIPMWPESGLQHLRPYALEAHDLILTKLERNVDVDRQDVQDLAAAGHLNQATLRERYMTEFRPNLPTGAEKHDLTLELWIEMCWPGEGRLA